MPIMNWDQSLDIGVDAMNHDHKQILDLMNRIYDARDKGGPGVNALVRQLGDVCVRHFRDEEAFMQSIAFPDFVSHKRVHERLLTKYGEYAVQTQNNQGRPPEEFFQFLRLWLSAHIKCIDIKYSAHSKKTRARTAA